MVLKQTSQKREKLLIPPPPTKRLTKKEKLLINSYQPPAKGSTSGHGTVHTRGFLGIGGNRREATYNEKLKANQSQNLKDLIKSLKYNVRMTPDSFRKLVKKVEKDTGQKIVFPNGSKEWAVYNANRNPSRWERTKKGRIQSHYDITKDTETMNLIGGKILRYNESLKDPQEVALDKSEAEYEERLSNLGKIHGPVINKAVYNQYGIQIQPATDIFGDEITPLTPKEVGISNLQIGTRHSLRKEIPQTEEEKKANKPVVYGDNTNIGPVLQKEDVQAPADFNQVEEVTSSNTRRGGNQKTRVRGWTTVRPEAASQDQITAAQTWLDLEGPGGRMTPQKMQAINLVSSNTKGTYQTRATANYFRDSLKEV